MTTGSAKSQDILSQMEGLGGKRKGENLIGSGRAASCTCGFPKLSLYKKHETQWNIGSCPSVSENAAQATVRGFMSP